MYGNRFSLSLCFLVLACGPDGSDEPDPDERAEKGCVDFCEKAGECGATPEVLVACSDWCEAYVDTFRNTDIWPPECQEAMASYVSCASDASCDAVGEFLKYTSADTQECREEWGAVCWH